ncbi:MAG TPA: hypothetical protein VGA37_16615 [Gemmatimonadales bacterium]
MRTRIWSLIGSLLVGLAGVAHAQVDSAYLAGMTARSIGPAGMSGRIGAIEAVAADPTIIYTGAATGGLWRSTNGGVSWTPIMDDYRAASIGAIAVFQPSPDIVWVGTGEKGRRNSSGVGTGVFKSMDGGETWTHLGLAETGAISEIILDPTNAAVAYVAALGTTWGENAARGVFKTTDGGRTWTKVLYVDERTGAADLVMDPGNPSKLFAAMWQHRRWPWFFNSGGPGSGLYLTWDGGTTWSELTEDDGLPAGDLGRIGLAIARGRPNVVYALVEATKSVLLRSDDGGRSFDTVNRDDNIAPRPFYYAQIEVDPENENRLYNIHGRVQVSEDGGKTFRLLTSFAVHPDHHAFWVNPNDGRLIIDGNDGGVYISRDRGASWRFVENLALAQFYHIAVDMATPFNVLGGLQDNGSWRGPSSVWESGGIRNYHWEEVGFGDGFATVPDPTDPAFGYAMSQGGNLMRWNRLTGERKSIRPAHPAGVDLRFNWNAAIALDPFDQATYYGSQFVHRTADHGHSWTIISPDLTTNDPEKQRQLESGGLTYDVTNAENHTTIMTIAPSPVERGVLWVGTDDGNVQLTRDGGQTWSNVVSRIRGVPAATWVPHIEPSKFDGGTAFVVFDDHRRANNAAYVYKTTDYGRSWTSLVTPALDGFVHVIEQDPVEPNLLYLGTEWGMFVSWTGGASWMLWRGGVPRAPVRALLVHPRDHDLVIATHGRAVYVLDDVRPLRALARDPQLVTRPIQLFDVPPAVEYMTKQSDGYRFIADAMFVGENRPYGAMMTYALAVDATDGAPAEGAGGTGLAPAAGASRGPQVSIDVLDADGNVIRTFRGPGRAGINRASWNLRTNAVQGPRSQGGGGGGGFFGPSGNLVLPGPYTIRIVQGADTVMGTVEVLPDPRYTLTVAERRDKMDALERVDRRRAVAAEAVNRLRELSRSVNTILQAARGTDVARALQRDGRAVRDSLQALDDLFMGPRDRQGIYRPSDVVWSMLGSVSSSMGSSWDRPTEAQMTYLRQAEQQLEHALTRMAALLEGQVTAFRAQVAAANMEVFPLVEPVGMDWEGR